MARTIDNLGLEISNRYAEDRSAVDETLIKESRLMPFPIEVESTKPSFAPELTALFELQLRGSRIALIQAPLGYYSQRRRLFTQQLIPILGSEEKKEAQISRIKGISEAEEENPNPETIFPDTLKKEGKILLNLLSIIHKYDQDLIDINSRRTQYHKG